jgi:hypothetical protein
MKRLIVMIVLVLTVSCLAFGQAKPQTQATSGEQELIQLEKEWSNAMLKRDVSFFDRVIVDDGMLTDPQGNVQTKAQFLADWKAGIFTYTSIVFDDMKIRIWGDTGIVWGRTTEKSQLKEKDNSGQYQWTDIFNKSSGHWQFVAGHMTKLVKK